MVAHVVEMATVRIECPNCQSVISNPEVVGEMVRCSSCEKWFKLNVAPPASASEKIRRNASMFAAIAGFMAIIGLIVGILSIIAVKSGDASATGFIIAAALIGAALWFYLIAQVVHIRANTEK